MQVERRLVKSPPELWAEVSDVEALTRHLARFGEISITRVEPETKVAWEGEHASGTVELAHSGWGTKVTLTAEPAAGAQDPAPAEVAAPAEPEGVAVAEPEDGPEPDTEPDGAEPAPPPAGERPRRRLRWLRFWRRERPAAELPPTPGPPTPPAPDPSPPAPEPSPPGPVPEPGPPPPPDPQPPQIALDPAETEAALMRVLDDLGQAHHRPFSRP